jgi:hypothetical protein
MTNIWHLKGKYNNTPIGFKVVKQDMRPLGLRSNPSQIIYEPGIWYWHSDDAVEAGIQLTK